MKIAILSGDGIGPEVMKEALKILDKVSQIHDLNFTTTEGLIGGAAWDEHKNHFPEKTKKLCEQSDAVLFGSVGGPIQDQSNPKWNDCEKNSILNLRKSLNLTVNLRPVKVYKQLEKLCPLKSKIIQKGIDIMCIRELSGDVYFGEHKTEIINGQRIASDNMAYDEETIGYIARKSFEIAKKRKQKLTSVDKANVLDCSKLWRTVVNEVHQEFPDCDLEHILVDNLAMQIIKRPSDFDTILMPNLFGDIISDEASVFCGSLGMLPSASFNKNGFGLYEPAGGSAPDIAGQNIANPIAQILCVALMLENSFYEYKAANNIYQAIEKTLNEGIFTKDIASNNTESVPTNIMGDFIIKNLTVN